ncbi:ADP-ribosylglycohydrolase family protein [Burkholderia aenigmatica]|uniref:ADP-ribosylglycohydrolase family protein n=1 Tax=Burkholderia aenigmatica TaxID=2015348 RepID=UPI001F1A89A4|nr:ADP-ribosylglycohydrolase family protein [Burkholderia aenigmatica]UKD11518.1 ADP-ribosylglycohydrolase family protein [Burkholderia aenigmatica]
MTDQNIEAIQCSALWAAYGDALGFMTELADRSMVRKRTGVDTVLNLRPWKRRIGGRFGIEAPLPVGAYSDDTQLRLATARAIQGDGHFDVEAFSKVELPVWLSYALGAGRATTMAASNLARRDTQWFANFYEEKGVSYVSSGGNGAAMRIQPHVWASRSPSVPSSYLTEVIQNAICTHGHPRAVAGAVFHAACLGRAMTRLSPLSMGDLIEAVESVSDIPLAIQRDNYLRDFWLPRWEEEANKSVDDAYRDVTHELGRLLDRVNDWMSRAPLAPYAELVELLGLDENSTRGSGTATAVAASAMSILLKDRKPDEILFEIVNTLGTDTDSIGTMAGALIGAVIQAPPPELPQDADWIVRDAQRLFEISRRKSVGSFGYPSLLGWEPPRTALDSVVADGNALFVTALGRANPIDPPLEVPSSKGAYGYQWIGLEFGQTALVKRRLSSAERQPAMPRQGELLARTPVSPEQPSRKTERAPAKDTLISEATVVLEKDRATSSGPARDGDDNLDLDILTAEAIQSQFDSRIIGEHIRALAEGAHPVDRSIAYVAIIAKALVARRRRNT